jgi:hypothetical protein
MMGAIISERPSWARKHPIMSKIPTKLTKKQFADHIDPYLSKATRLHLSHSWLQAIQLHSGLTAFQALTQVDNTRFGGTRKCERAERGVEAT